MKKYLVPVLVTGVLGALISFGTYLWIRQNDLEARFNALDQAGAVSVARIEECRELAANFVSNTASSFAGPAARAAARRVFEERGCVEVQVSGNAL